jgi:hypothetical protein
MSDMTEYILPIAAAAAAGTTVYAIRRERNKAKNVLRKEIDKVPECDRLQYFESQLGCINKIDEEFPSVLVSSKQRDRIVSVIRSPMIGVLKSLSKEYLSRAEYLKFSEKL